MEQSMWVINKILDEIEHPYKEMDENATKTLPLDNLTMLLEQVKTLIPQKKKTTRKNDVLFRGAGNSIREVRS
jgi:hypothetical protein